MNRLLLFHALLTIVLACAIRLLISESAATGFVYGSIISFVNLAILMLVWPWLLAKKLIALSVGIIVIKFAILAWVLFEVASKNLVRVDWFASGLGMIILTVLSASVLLPSSLSFERRLS